MDNDKPFLEVNYGLSGEIKTIRFTPDNLPYFDSFVLEVTELTQKWVSHKDRASLNKAINLITRAFGDMKDG